MKRLAIGIGLATALVLGCSKKDDTGELPAICEDYLTRYKCSMKDSSASGPSSDAIRKGWVTAATGGGPARTQVAESCRQQLELQKKSFADKGCGAP